MQGFHRTYATGAACQQGTLTPPDTWTCPTLGLACFLMSRRISPELVLSLDFWIRTSLGTSLLLSSLENSNPVVYCNLNKYINQNFYTAVADRPRTVSCNDTSHQTCVVNRFRGAIPFAKLFYQMYVHKLPAFTTNAMNLDFKSSISPGWVVMFLYSYLMVLTFLS